MEINADGAPDKSALISFLREGLRLSIKAQMEHCGRELDSWEELVEKAIDAEAKANLHPPPASKRWINAALGATCLLIPPWPSLRPRAHQPETLRNSILKRLRSRAFALFLSLSAPTFLALRDLRERLYPGYRCQCDQCQ